MLHTADNLTQTWTTNNKWIKIFPPKFFSVSMLFDSAQKLCNDWSVNSRSLLAAASLDVPAKNRCHQSKCSKCGTRLMIRSAWCSRWLMLLPHSCIALTCCVLSCVSCQDRSLSTHFILADGVIQEQQLYFTDKRSKREGEKVKKKKKDRKRETCYCGIWEMACSPWAGRGYWIPEMRLHRLPPFACGDKNRTDRASEAFAFLRNHAAALLSSNPHPGRASSLPFLSSSLPSRPFLIKCFRTSRVMNLL